MRHVNGNQRLTFIEHSVHPFHVGGVEMRKVEGGQSFATSEHQM